MPSERPATTIRFTDEDREVLTRLQKLTGLDSSAAIIRMALREALASRRAAPDRKKMVAIARQFLELQPSGADALLADKFRDALKAALEGAGPEWLRKHREVDIREALRMYLGLLEEHPDLVGRPISRSGRETWEVKERKR